MGKSNDYLTLEQSSRILGRPVSFLKTLLSKGEVGAKLAGGQWLIAARDLDELLETLPPESEKVVHDFLTKRPQKKRQEVPDSYFNKTSVNKEIKVSVGSRNLKGR